MATYSPTIEDLLEKGKNIYEKIKRLSDNLFQKKEKIISINNFRRQYKQKIEYFTIEKQKGILFDDIMLAYKNIDNMADIKKHLEKYDTEESRIYLKNISSYKKQIEKFKAKVVPGKIDEDERSEILTNKFVTTLKDYFITKFLPSIYNGTEDRLNPFNRDLLRYVNSYLKNIFVYSGSYSDYKIGKNPNDENYKYIDIATTKTNDKKLHETIKEVEMLPYFIDYRDEDGIIKRNWIQGKVTIYKFSEKI
jgi:hypothetical protein